MGAQMYLATLAAEKTRNAVFNGTARPRIGTPTAPLHVEHQLAALREIAGAQFDEARRLLDAAEEERPAISGTAGGRKFEDFRNYDDRFGGVLECIRGADYYWIPFPMIKSLLVEAPKKLRDLVWAPARLEDREGNKTELLLPVRYPGSETSPDPAVRLGRVTEWAEVGPGISVGHGVHSFLTDDLDLGLLELGRIEFDEGAEAPS
jgi:type VI secretion system protein ImpE